MILSVSANCISPEGNTLPFCPVNIPGVCTCPNPGHALQTTVLISANESDLTFNSVGNINFLFNISTPVLLSINSFGLIPIRVSLLIPLITFSPLEAEYI